MLLDITEGLVPTCVFRYSDILEDALLATAGMVC
jgi:hypothetical protein